MAESRLEVLVDPKPSQPQAPPDSVHPVTKANQKSGKTLRYATSVALRDIGREQVLAAIGEYDRLGQDEFLSAYGFHPAREYLLVHNGNVYDSKAIVGVAHRYLDGQQALKASEFSGGEATVGRLLKDLGFIVQVGPESMTPDRLASVHGHSGWRCRRRFASLRLRMV